MRRSLLVAVGGAALLTTACNRGKTTLGGGPEKDARMISDVFTWECQTSDGGIIYQGVFAQTVSLEYAPDALSELALPSAGACSVDLSMFPEDAGSGGSAIPDLSDEPRWSTDVDSGELDAMTDGFWYDSVLDNVHSCQEVGSILSGGTTLEDAGALSGVTTPEPAEMPDVELDGDYDNGIPWGTELVASWDEHDWDSVWIQIRREREGVAWESVTCNATGLDEFTIDDDIWNLMTESLNVEVNNLYVGFQKSDEAVTDDGQKVELLTRSVSVAVVQD